MRSGTSFSERGLFSGALLKKNISRFWPIWSVYTAILFFVLPMTIIQESGYYYYSNMGERVIRIANGAMGVSVFFGVCYGLLLAMALFSYLMNPRSAGMIHSLPVRREGLFLTNWVSGAAFILIPHIAITVATVVAQATAGALNVGEALTWMVVQSVVSLYFFSLAVFCAMFTGNILALPVFYGIINGLVGGIAVLADAALDVMLMGYDPRGLVGSAAVRWLTPIYYLAEKTTGGYVRDEMSNIVASIQPENVAMTAAYSLGVGALLTVAALLVYRKRHLERAGDLVTVGWVRPVFQWGLGICGGTALGLLLWVNFFEGFGRWGFAAVAVVCSVFFAFAGRMLLKKTLKVFAEGWKGCVLMAACFALLLTAAGLDLFGYQRWTPDPDQVVQVDVRGVNSYPNDEASYLSLMVVSDPELVARMVDIHEKVVSELDMLEAAELADYRGYGYYGVAEPMPVDSMSVIYRAESTASLWVEYTLNNGRVASRQYTLPISSQALKDPDSYASALQDFLNTDGVRDWTYYGTNFGMDTDIEELEVDSAVLSGVPRKGYTEEELKRYDEDGDGKLSDEEFEMYGISRWTNHDLVREEAEVLWTAVKADLAAGRLGRRYLVADEEMYENCTYTDIRFRLLWTVHDGTWEEDLRSVNFTVTIQNTATETWKALKELGLEDMVVEWTPNM